MRAELMTLAPGSRISDDMALREQVDLDDEWWNELRNSLDTLAAHPTDRICLDEQFMRRGSAPTGYDAALLLCTSLLQPEIAERVRATFADLLDAPGGHVAQLLAAAKLLGLVEYGDHPDLAVPVHRHARAVIDQINPRR